MRNVLLLQAANHFNDHGTAGFVVAAQHRRLVGANDVAFDDWLDAFAGNYGVHVRAHHDGIGSGNRSRKTRDDIAAVAAHCSAGVVNLDLRAHLFAILLDALGDVAFFARVTVDLHEFEQKVLDAFLIDHPSYLKIRPAFRIQKPYAPDEFPTRFLFDRPMTIAAQLPVPDHHGHLTPGFHAVKRLAAEKAHDLGVGAHFGVHFKIIFAPHAQEKSFSLELNFRHGNSSRLRAG